ncbi:MAG TPA: lysozyme inhibitor LprI family protein [Gemmatimonadaceae bacterium]
MSRDEFDPDLSSLSNDYEILAPLRGSENTRRYLARHNGLNRDVTITVVRVPSATKDSGGDNTLTHYASDARTLSVMRHPNIVPVVEGRWLPDSGAVFAVVRARVRGATVEHIVESESALPTSQVADALEQVQAAIEWARNNGIVHRHVSMTSIVFQQGSGRVMLELDPVPLRVDALPDICDDARTIGALAYEMLSGRRPDEKTPIPLAELRGDLPPEIANEIEGLMRCTNAADARGVGGLVTLLRAVREPEFATTARGTAVGAAAARPRAQRPFGYHARIASAAVVVVIVGVLSLFMLNRNERPPQRATATKSANKSGSAAGEVNVPKSRTDSQRSTAPPRSVIPLPTSPPPRVSAPADTRKQQQRRNVAPSKPNAPAGRETVEAPVIVPPPDTITLRPVIPAVGCASPEPAAQEACLSVAIERGDQVLNNTYYTLIAALRRQAGTPYNGPDPPTVNALRTAQRTWAEGRAAECNAVGAAPLYAEARAQCYAERATTRARELSERISAIP